MSALDECMLGQGFVSRINQEPDVMSITALRRVECE